MLAGATVGALQALNLPIAWLLMKRLIPHLPLASLIAGLLISASGAMTLAETGTSFADLLTAIPVLVGILLLVRNTSARSIDTFAGGFLLGAAVGLKLTNTTFALGALAMVLFGDRPMRSIVLLGLGGGSGALITGGVWAAYLWREFSSPLFPFYNGLFQSPAGPSWNHHDARFFPHGVMDALSYPYRWVGRGSSTTEVPFRDARFAVIIVLAGVTVGIGALRRAWPLSRRETQLSVFFVASFAIWMLMFSIQRYLVALEILSGPLAVILVHRIVPMSAKEILPAIAVALAMWVQPGDWWHRPWADPYTGSPAHGEIETQPATYFLVEKPVAFVIRYLPEESRFYQLADPDLPILPSSPFDERIRAGLSDPLPGGNWVMHIKGRPIPDMVGAYDLQVDSAHQCTTLAGAIFVDVEVCPLRVSQAP
jgi:hypothetical protein